jgi:hypothetical protein
MIPPIVTRANRKPAWQDAPPRLRASQIERPFVPEREAKKPRAEWYGRR